MITASLSGVALTPIIRPVRAYYLEVLQLNGAAIVGLVKVDRGIVGVGTNRCTASTPHCRNMRQYTG